MRPMLRWALAVWLVPAVAAPVQAAPPAPLTPPVSLGPACGGQAARYENGKGFALFAIRAGDVRIDNPLRPLTPDYTHVLEVIVGGKRATAYGPDYASLRRGGPPGAMQGLLGAPIRWAPSLPALPDSLGIVAEDGALLATLAFSACETPPVVAPEPVPKVAKKTGKPSAQKAKDGKTSAAKPAAKTPQGFTMPSGAIAE